MDISDPEFGSRKWLQLQRVKRNVKAQQRLVRQDELAESAARKASAAVLLSGLAVRLTLATLLVAVIP